MLTLGGVSGEYASLGDEEHGFAGVTGPAGLFSGSGGL